MPKLGSPLHLLIYRHVTHITLHYDYTYTKGAQSMATCLIIVFQRLTFIDILYIAGVRPEL